MMTVIIIIFMVYKHGCAAGKGFNDKIANTVRFKTIKLNKTSILIYNLRENETTDSLTSRAQFCFRDPH